MKSDPTEVTRFDASTDPSNYYAILLEWSRDGIDSGRRIIVEQKDVAFFKELLDWLLTATDIVYGGMRLDAGHRDFAGLFTDLVDYPVPEGNDDYLDSGDVIPAFRLFIAHYRSKITSGFDFEDFLDKSNRFLSALNMWVTDRSYVSLPCLGTLPEFGERLIEREVSRYSKRDPQLTVSEETAAWFGRLNIVMAAKGSATDRTLSECLVKLIDDFNEMYA
jgi:hypothetical protein